MIRLYYTGAQSNKAPQNNAIQSLGGSISNSPVPNDEIDALFGSISQSILQNGSEEYRCLAFVNEATVAKTISLYYENTSQEPVSSFKMALAAPALNGCSEPYFERIANVFSKPLINFRDNRGVANALNFTIQPNQILGLWIQRSISKVQGQSFLSCDALIARHDITDSNQQDSITLTDGDIQNTYWILNTITSSIYIAYGSPALPTDKEIISINIPQDSTNDTILSLTAEKLNGILEPRGECKATVVEGVLKIDHLVAGKIAPSSKQTAPINITSIAGKSSTIEISESLEICIDY